MGRNSKVGKKTSSRKPRPAEGKGRVRRGRPKVCRFCSTHAVWVDYKDVNLLARYMNDRGRIRPRGATGTCAQHQRDVAVAIKTARELALLPYSVRTMSADSGDRRGGRRGRPEGSPAAETGSDGAEADSADDGAAERKDGEDPVGPEDAGDARDAGDAVEVPERTPVSDGQPPEDAPTVQADA